MKTMPEKWSALWIDPELPHDPDTRQPASYLRRRFTLEETAAAAYGNGQSTADGRPTADKQAPDASKGAFLYITCHGLYACFLNGRRVGNFVLAPGTGDYHKRLFVQRYDVTDLVRPGENELLVILGDGWYRGCVGIDGLTNYYGEDLALLLQLETDGVPAVVSDGSWEASQCGPVRENDLQQGEAYDARMEEITGWHGVTVRDYGYDNLAPDLGVPVIEQERFPGRLIRTPDGGTVVDFGQNLAGYTEIRLTARAGQRIVLRHGETLDERGNFTQANFDPGERNKQGIAQKSEYICRDGVNVWKPLFAVYGFRYAKVETDIDLADASFTAVAVYSRMPRTGFFECGNEDVNRLFLNSLWSMRSNFLDIPTDCPTRERAGWTGDAGVFAPTAVCLADCYPVYRKWLGECRLAQGENGLVQNIAPVNNSGSMISNMLQGSAGWGDACVLVPWALYEACGDREILAENYDMMRRWVEFCRERAKATRPQNEANPWKEYLVDQGFHFGEWCQPDIDNGEAMKSAMMNGAPEVATAYFYRSASLLSRIADILGKPEDAAEYADLAEKIKKAYRFTCTKDGAVDSDRQCAYVRPVAFGLLDGEENQAAADRLNDLVVDNGYRLNTGFLSTPDLCRVLSDYGHADTAYSLLLNPECPGWLYAVRKGATTIWETWDGIRPDGTVHDSLNHYAYGAVTGWFFDSVCGIRLSAGRLKIAPKPCRDLKYARAKRLTPAGEIRSEWCYDEDTLRLHFAVPADAVLSLPDGRELTVTEGEYDYELPV